MRRLQDFQTEPTHTTLSPPGAEVRAGLMAGARARMWRPSCRPASLNSHTHSASPAAAFSAIPRVSAAKCALEKES